MRRERLEELKEYIYELETIKKVFNDNVKKRFISSTPYLFTLRNGRVIPREQLLKNGISGSAVMVAPQIKDSDEFIVNIEPRVFTHEGVAVSFPAGYIESGEKPIEAAMRELREETGYTAREFVLLDSFYQDEGVSAAFNHSFLALDSERKYEQELGENEIVKYMSLTLDEILEVEKMGYVSGSNTKLTLAKIKDYYRR